MRVYLLIRHTEGGDCVDSVFLEEEDAIVEKQVLESQITRDICAFSIEEYIVR